MHRTDFSYELPEELIAQEPLPQRVDSRLLCLEREGGALAHRRFRDLPSLLQPEDLLVFNNTRVLPARLWGRKPTGGAVEILVERLRGEQEALVHLRASKTPKPDTHILLCEEPDAEPGAERLTVLGREDDLFLVTSEGAPLVEILARIGHMPLPPYIERSDNAADRERYQTVYGRREGSVAAPTAGLHFDEPMLERLRAQGVHTAEVTLHIGAGTFQPVRADNISEHQMHAEYLEVDAALCAAVAATRERGGRVVAVGTTAVRSLESAAAGGELKPCIGDTRLFIYPGYRFRVVDALITNFHLPESTLIMLVSAFAGREEVLAAYREAVRERYRFFSYGDAMFIAAGACRALAG